MTPTGAGTDVSWRMTGERKGVGGVCMRAFTMEKAVGGDFERGLTRLKAVDEER